MKNQPITRRFHYAWQGIKASWQSEKSFRAHVYAFIYVVCLLLLLRPAAVWWAMLMLAAGLMMAVELINTAIEKLADHIHPELHATIGVVKDTLAGAVLVACVAGGLVLALFVALGR